jgi:predicted dehydrogenase
VLRSVFIGCGPRAREHARAYRSVTRGQPVAACARTREHVDAFCDELGIDGRYTDVDRMLEAERPDLVHVVTDARMRVALMRRVATQGAPVAIVEKPIAIQGEDWRELRELSAASSTAFVVNTQLRFHPRAVELQRSVAEGAIGEIRLIETSARSTLLDQGVHLLDLAHWFAGDARASDVFAQMSGIEAMSLPEPSPDIAAAAIRFEGGVRAQLLTGSIAPSIDPSAPFYLHKRIAVHGSRGSVQWTMSGWERFTADHGDEHGALEYELEDDLAQAALIDSAFAAADPDAPPHPTRLDRSLEQFNVLLGAYLSFLRREPVELPCEPEPDMLGAIRRELDPSLGSSRIRP